MCELTGDKMDQATRDEMRRVDVMAKTLRGIDAFFAPYLARSDAQSRKIAKAARLCREVEEEERDDTRAEERAAWLAARTENDGAQP